MLGRLFIAWKWPLIILGIIIIGTISVLVYNAGSSLSTSYDDCNDEGFREKVVKLIQRKAPDAIKIYPGAIEVKEEGRDIACRGVAATGEEGNRYVIYYAWEDADGDSFLGYRMEGAAPPGAPVLNEPTPTPTPASAKNARAEVSTQRPSSNRVRVPTPTRRVVATGRNNPDLIIRNIGGVGIVIVKPSNPMYQDIYTYLHSGIGTQSSPNNFALSASDFDQFMVMIQAPSGLFGATPTAVLPIPGQEWTVERLAKCNTYSLRRQMDSVLASKTEEAGPLSDCEVALFDIYMDTSAAIESLNNATDYKTKEEIERIYYTLGGIKNFLLDLQEGVARLNPNAVMNICRAIPEWERDLQNGSRILEKYQAQGFDLKGIEIDIIRAKVLVEDITEIC